MALGVVGAFLPVMPTVVFLLAASACYARGNPAFRTRLLAHPKFGPPVRDWEEHRAISLRGKLLGSLLVTAGIAASLLWGVEADWLRVVLLLIWAAIVGFLLSVKTRR